MDCKLHSEDECTVSIELIPDVNRDIPIFDDSIKEDTIKKINDIVVSNFYDKPKTKYIVSKNSLLGFMPLIDSVTNDIKKDL